MTTEIFMFLTMKLFIFIHDFMDFLTSQNQLKDKMEKSSVLAPTFACHEPLCLPATRSSSASAPSSSSKVQLPVLLVKIRVA